MTVRRNLTQDGFALVETLIATAIIAVMTAAFFQVVAGHARSVQTISERRAAVLVARSALDAAVGDNEDIVPRRGTDSRLQWRVTINPYEPRTGGAPPLELVTVTVAPVGGDRAILQLRSLRTGR